MIFYLAVDENGRSSYVGTQADARAINRNFEQIDVPTDKPSLLVFLNEMQARIDGAPNPDPTAEQWAEMQASVGPIPELTPISADAFEPVTVTVEKVVPIPSEDLTDTQLFQRLSSDMADLDRRAGYRGWAAFAKSLYHWSPAARGAERGLGMILLNGLLVQDTCAAEPDAPPATG